MSHVDFGAPSRGGEGGITTSDIHRGLGMHRKTYMQPSITSNPSSKQPGKVHPNGGKVAKSEPLVCNIHSPLGKSKLRGSPPSESRIPFSRLFERKEEKVEKLTACGVHPSRQLVKMLGVLLFLIKTRAKKKKRGGGVNPRRSSDGAGKATEDLLLPLPLLLRPISLSKNTPVTHIHTQKSSKGGGGEKQQ